MHIRETRMQSHAENDSDVMLKAENVTKKYGKIAALEDVSINLKRGRHLLVLGPNGAGKTTLVKCILGLARFNGSIYVAGLSVKKASTEVKRLVGYVPQNYAFYENISVNEQAKMSCHLKRVGISQAEEKLNIVDLWRVRNKKIRALSDGMKQRLGIALALIGNPPFIILDEPTTNVDLNGQIEFQGLLTKLVEGGITLLTATHLTGLGELANEILVLDGGHQVAFGEPSALLNKVNIADTLYVKVKKDRIGVVTDLIESLVSNSLAVNGEWLTVSVPTNLKLRLLRSLIEDGDSVQDVVVERTRIESEYLKLLGANHP